MKKRTDKKYLIILAWLAVILVVLAAVILIPSFGSKKGYRTIYVVEVSGRVSVVKNDIEYSAYPGMILQEGHEVVTSGNGFIRLVLDGDKYIKLEPGSKLLFETLGFTGSGKTRLCLERGSISTELVSPLLEDEDYVINTPNAVLAVRGTFFRVDLFTNDAGEIISDVKTYGGQVASQRILPNGTVVEEEVLINAGYMACINMDTEDTIYVVDKEIPVETPNQTFEKTIPIPKEEISDSDLIDIYFAADNGHQMFVPTEELKNDIENREIVLSEQVSV
jgi:hypothetical protein